MKAPIGSVVKLTYDSPRAVSPGDVLKTLAGRMYLICETRRQVKGLHVGRWHLQAIIVDEVPEGAHVHPIYWYRRRRKRTP